MWRAPALDFVVSAGVTYRARDGVEVDRAASVYAAGEIARLSYDAQVTTNQKGMPSRRCACAPTARTRTAACSGPLKATHFGFGDVEGFDSRLTGSSGERPRGGRHQPAADRADGVRPHPLRGRSADRLGSRDLPQRRAARLCQGRSPTSAMCLTTFSFSTARTGSAIVLYGPQGQVRTREEMINVGQDNVPPGKTWYWAGVNQPGRDLVTLHKPPDSDAACPRRRPALSLEHGIDERTSVGALARMMLVDDERLTFVEGTVRRSIGPALVEVGVAREMSRRNGRARADSRQDSARSTSVPRRLLRMIFICMEGGRKACATIASGSMRRSRLGRTVLPAHADVRLSDRRDGTRQLDAAARLSANFERFNLATGVRYRKQYLGSGRRRRRASSTLDLIGSGRVGDVRLRGRRPASTCRAKRALPLGRAVGLLVGVRQRRLGRRRSLYDAASKQAAARGSPMSAASTAWRSPSPARRRPTARWRSASTSISRSIRDGGFSAVAAAAGRKPASVRAPVYRDLNDNGVREPSEPFEKGALVTTGTVSRNRRPTPRAR